MFGFLKRKRERRNREVAEQVNAIQRHLFSQLRPHLVTQHGAILGAQLAQAVVDRLFARPASLHGTELHLVETLSDTLAKENVVVREVALVSLKAILTFEQGKNDPKAVQRISETIQWLEGFGEVSNEISLTNALERIQNTPF